MLKQRLQGERIRNANLSLVQLSRQFSELFPLAMDNKKGWLDQLDESSSTSKQQSEIDDPHSSIPVAVRRNIICDILSTFESSQLPEDLAVAQPLMAPTLPQSCLRGSLSETLYQLVSSSFLQLIRYEKNITNCTLFLLMLSNTQFKDTNYC